MSALRLLRNAGAVTFVVYVCITILAALPSVGSWGAVHRALDASGEIEGALQRPGGEMLVEAAREIFGARGTLWVSLGVGAIALLFISPFLQTAWLTAMQCRSSLREALVRGAQLWVDALEVSLFLLPVLIAAIAISGLLMVGADSVLSAPQDARIHDLVLAGLFLLSLLLVSVWATWHDLARASIVAHAARGGDAVRIAFVHLRARNIGAYVVWWSIGAIVAVAGQILCATLDWNRAWSALLALALTQLFALTRVLARGYWLASCLERVSQ